MYPALVALNEDFNLYLIKYLGYTCAFSKTTDSSGLLILSTQESYRVFRPRSYVRGDSFDCVSDWNLSHKDKDKTVYSPGSRGLRNDLGPVTRGNNFGAP